MSKTSPIFQCDVSETKLCYVGIYIIIWQIFFICKCYTTTIPYYNLISTVKALQNVTSPFLTIKGLRADNLSRVSSPLSCQIRKRRDEFTRKRSSKLNQDHQDSSWDTSPFLSLTLYHIWSLRIILPPWIYFQGNVTNYEYYLCKKQRTLGSLYWWLECNFLTHCAPLML